MPAARTSLKKPAKRPAPALPIGAPEVESDVATRILDAAFEQFCLVGIRRTSMEDVARRAKVGRVTIYRKFENHDKLVAALLARETKAAIAKVEAATSAVTDIEERFVEGFVAGMGAIRKHPLIVALIATEPERALPMLTTHGAGGLALARASMAQEIRRAHKALNVRNLDADQIAEILARITHSLVLTPQTLFPLDDEKRMRDFARRYIVPIVTGRAYQSR